ncbi:DUF4136 domain-containing protein [Paraburkholderia kururiensis]|uniref:DUF4136 domain-containing protein n=1 Tax=Paraburkholderia kururiensis TaxID=984307 RepID=UPI000B2A02D6|nr:DUF4136 domain-containing protein [Paraburkholderia kururiensis]
MKTFLLTCVVLAAASLAGCAGVRTEVQATGMHEAPQGDLRYRFMRTPAQQADVGQSTWESQLRDALAQHGFSDANDANEANAASGAADATRGSRYLISVAYETRPVGIAVRGPECASNADNCGANDAPREASPFAGRYLHRLTLRFIDARSGEEIYKVTGTRRDRDAHASPAFGYLVKSALARFPFDGGRWQIELREADDGRQADVVSVKPLSP